MTGDKSPGQQIDDIISKYADWRGDVLARLRALIMRASPALVEEVKWKKPSKPEGVPVWSCAGIVCVGEVLKHAVRLTFPKGAYIQDPKQLFNARLDSSSVRAVDFHEGDIIDGAAVQTLVQAAISYNGQKSG